MSTWAEKATAVCTACGGRCCYHANPPITAERENILRIQNVKEDCFESPGYRRLRSREDGGCVLLNEQNLCSLHRTKPETCVAGPFTFDFRDDAIEIYLKKESICPLVAVLKDDAVAYKEQYDEAVQRIVRLVAFLPEEELDAVCMIEEPETELVSKLQI
jgi:Fe-S-cluster containining protein